MNTATPTTGQTRLSLLLSVGFRCFFLLGGVFAVVAILAWIGLLHGFIWPAPPANPVLWHAHEMLFGFVGAAIAGFLLTAIPNWTGLPPLAGARLGLLAAAWLAGRLAMALSGMLPALPLALIDLVFPVLLAAAVMRMLVATGNRRNYVLGGLITLLPLINLAFHLGQLGVISHGERAVYLLPQLAALLLVIIGGRIIPSFTDSWLRRQSETQRRTVNRAWLERLVIPLTALTGIALGVAPGSLLAGGLALAAAVAHALRLSGWRGQLTLREPLLAVLHLGYVWLVISYLLFALYAFTGLISHSAALHALTVGALATAILAVMSRVALGHTGRPLRAARLTVLAYALLSAAAAARVLASSISASYGALVDLSSLLWALAFAAFLWVYWPILTGPRADSPTVKACPGAAGLAGKT